MSNNNIGHDKKLPKHAGAGRAAAGGEKTITENLFPSFCESYAYCCVTQWQVTADDDILEEAFTLGSNTKKREKVYNFIINIFQRGRHKNNKDENSRTRKCISFFILLIFFS